MVEHKRFSFSKWFYILFVETHCQSVAMLKKRGGIYCLTLYTEHKFINKHVLLPETEFLLNCVTLRSNDMDEKSYLFNAEIGRYGDYISRITVMDCKECNKVCLNVISEDSQIINHQTVSLPVAVYINRHKNFLSVFQNDDGGDDYALIWSTSIKIDGVYTCTVKSEWCGKLCV